MLFRIIRGICFLWFVFVLGLILVINGLSASTFFDKTKDCTVPAIGKVTLNERRDEYIRRKNNGEGPDSEWNSYVLTTEYNVGNELTITELSVSENIAIRYPAGSSIELMYNPDKVTETCIVGVDKPGSVVGNVMFFIGLAAVIGAPIGTVVMIVKAIRSRSEA